MPMPEPLQETTQFRLAPLIDELRQKIVEVLNLQDVDPQAIDPDEQLVGGRLGIDSIDVLEMVMLVEKEYGLTIDNREVGARVFASVRALAGFINDPSPTRPN
jgi:acyl carrier protein